MSLSACFTRPKRVRKFVFSSFCVGKSSSVFRAPQKSKKKDMSLLLAGRVSPPPSSPPARALARKAKVSRKFSSLRASSSSSSAAALLNAARKERATTSSKLRGEGFRGKIFPRSRHAFTLTKNAKNATACKATAGGNSDDDGNAANMSARELKRALGEMVRFPSFLCLSCLVLLQKVHSLEREREPSSKEKNVDD